MNRWEKRITIFTGMYGVFMFCLMIGLSRSHEADFPGLRYYAILGFVLIFVVYIIIFKDVYLRKFPSSGSKIIWSILVLTQPVCIPLYLYQHAFHPRIAVDPDPGDVE